MPLPNRIGRLRPPVLCLVVSKATAPDGDVVKLVTEAVAGGVDMVQLRDRDLPSGELLELARNLKRVTRGKALLVINDRVDIAQAVEADGIELPEAGLPTRVARTLIGRYSVVGRSVHDVDAARQAQADNVEFVVAGTIYKTASKPDAKPVGTGLIAEITKDSPLPVLAIGGITADKVSDVIKAGAAGVAVISAITKADDPKEAAKALNDALKEAWGGPRHGSHSQRVIQQPITLTVNGRERTLSGEPTLPALLAELGVDRRMIAVAYNGDVIPRATYDNVTLHDGDRVEVVRMVGGG